jgi:hypothetical protein
MIAPRQLPFAPRPISTELLSSWLLRVAAANFIQLSELLAGFECRYGRVLTTVPIDYCLPDAALTALSQFCRVPGKKIRALDLHQRAPNLNPALLLCFQNSSICPRCSPRRVRYTFCPLCLSDQQVIHVRWDWSVACLIRCAVHRTPLLDGCPACGEPDPLTFAGSELSPNRLCRSCSSDLSKDAHESKSIQSESDIQAVEDAYRTALLGTAPVLLGKATDRVFRQFVEDMLQVLTRTLNPCPAWGTCAVPFPRHDILRIIGELILNAAPSSDSCVRRKRYSRGLLLWVTLLKFIPAHEGPAIEKSSLRWPVALRRRFVSALYRLSRKRWPNPPYRAAFAKPIEARREIAAVYDLRPHHREYCRLRGAEFCPGFNCSTDGSVRDLSAAKVPCDEQSAI